ncbi:MAG TPA: xanthine dehydrogenase family protein subunit M [Alphaproteobacteria bacterium]|nr:xanthine dehydrogenase family protein subunit M [Alphaproteobacteria bacterium]
MDYSAPETIGEAVRLLAADDEARCLAGGQSLVAMMNTRILAPSHVISLRRIPGLDRIEARDDGGLRIGAMVTHQSLAELSVEGAHRLLPVTARQIASPAIRAFGTLGGSLCHADPAADWPTAMVCIGAMIGIAGPHGERSEPVGEFIVDMLTTSLEPGEILTHVDLPPAHDASGAAYLKLARVEGDFATVAVAVTLRLADARCAEIGVAIGGCGPVPVRVEEAERILVGSALSEADISSAADILREAIAPEDDIRASAAYRKKILPGLLSRAIAAAKADAGGAGQ